MQKVSGFIEWLGTEPGKAVIAGALGGVVRWLTLRNSFIEGMISLAVGGICALYLGPLVVPLIEPVLGKIAPGGDVNGFSSFLVGIGGISFSGFLLEIFEKRRKDLGGKDDASS